MATITATITANTRSARIPRARGLVTQARTHRGQTGALTLGRARLTPVVPIPELDTDGMRVVYTMADGTMHSHALGCVDQAHAKLYAQPTTVRRFLFPYEVPGAARVFPCGA